MQEIEKISLLPTRPTKKCASHAVGSAIFHEGGKHISLNLFNLPEPQAFLTTLKDVPKYQSWLFNPETGEVQSLGSCEQAGDGLYLLYDVPITSLQGFSEIIVTVEEKTGKAPKGEILLIGFLNSSHSESLEKFNPFSLPIPGHKWWKVKQSTNTNYYPSHSLCYFCSGRQNTCSQAPVSRQGFDLPEILGLVTDESENIQYIVHGIPGRLLLTEQPGRGHTGYLHWMPYYGVEERIGAMGYWLCYLDPHTNQIVTPLGVTIPPG